MNLDELKAEAKKQGYNLIKASKYPTKLKCPNCNKKPELWARLNTYIVRCSICGHEEEAEKKTWAVNKWNNWVEKR